MHNFQKGWIFFLRFQAWPLFSKRLGGEDTLPDYGKLIYYGIFVGTESYPAIMERSHIQLPPSHGQARQGVSALYKAQPSGKATHQGHRVQNRSERGITFWWSNEWAPQAWWLPHPWGADAVFSTRSAGLRWVRISVCYARTSWYRLNSQDWQLGRSTFRQWTRVLRPASRTDHRSSSNDFPRVSS